MGFNLRAEIRSRLLLTDIENGDGGDTEDGSADWLRAHQTELARCV
jgi:hypothetical protein